VLVEDGVLAGQGVDATEAVPDVRVLGGDAQGDLLAAASDEDGDPARRGRVESVPALANAGQVGA